jgi:hypothetical protein
MGPANVAPWLEQVGDGLAKKVTVLAQRADAADGDSR